MNFKHTLTIIGLGAAAALPIPAFSQMQGYAGASLGTSNAPKFCETLTTGCDKQSSAWRIFSGVRFSRNLAAEVAYVDLGKVTANNTATGTNTKIENAASELAALLILPANRVSVFGKVGGYYAKTKSTVEAGGGTTYGRESSGGLTYGVGAQYDFTPNFSVRADWQRYAKVGGSDTGGGMDIDAWLIGAVWNFE